MRNKIIIAIGGLAVIAIVAYVYALPYITINNIIAAIQSNDADTLSDYVDFPSLRQDLKDQMNIVMAKSMREKLKDNPFAVLGVALAGMFVDKMADTFVTPAGLSNLMQGKSNIKKKKDTSSENSVNIQAIKELFKDAEFSYDSTSKFVVVVTDKEKKEHKYIFRRNGLEWKLTSIKFPNSMSFLKPPVKQEIVDMGTRQLSFHAVDGAFVDSEKAGQIFVVRGMVKNGYPKSRSFILIKVEILDDKGEVVRRKLAYAGNSFKKEELKVMPMEEIGKAMKNRYGMGRKNFNVPTNTTLPFMAVFEDLPKNLGEFTVEAASSSPGLAEQ